MDLLFWLKRSKANSAGLAPVSLRITLHGQRSEFSTGLRCLPAEWNPKTGRFRGADDVADLRNSKLRSLEARALLLLERLLLTAPDQLGITAQQLHRALKPAKPTVVADPLLSTALEQARQQHYGAGNGATLRTHGSALAAWARWNGAGTLRLSQLTPAHARRFAGWLTEHYAPTTCATWLNSLRALLTRAAPQLLPNPFDHLAPKNAADQAKRRVHLSRAQLQALRELPLTRAAQQLARAVYLSQYYLHGCRISNVLELRWQDVDWAAGRVRFKAVKRGQYKDIALSPTLRALWEPYRASGSPLVLPVLPAGYFGLERQLRFRACSAATARVNGALGLISKQMGLSERLHSHTARHTLAGHAGKIDKYTAQAMLGHRSIEQTEHYLESLSTAELDAAAAAVYDLL